MEAKVLKKDLVIKAHTEGLSAREIARKYDVWESSVYRIISDYKKEQELAALKLKVQQ